MRPPTFPLYAQIINKILLQRKKKLNVYCLKLQFVFPAIINEGANVITNGTASHNRQAVI